MFYTMAIKGWGNLDSVTTMTMSLIIALLLNGIITTIVQVMSDISRSESTHFKESF